MARDFLGLLFYGSTIYVAQISRIQHFFFIFEMIFEKGHISDSFNALVALSETADTVWMQTRHHGVKPLILNAYYHP